MNDLTQERFFTTAEIAEQLGTSPKVILENAKKCLPNKKIRNGAPTYWDKAEVTILIDYVKGNSHRNDTTFTNLVKVTETDLSPALKIKKALELMQEGYEEELERLRILNAEKEKQLQEQAPKVEFFDDVTGSDDTIDMKEVAKLLNMGIGRNKLFELLRDKKILDGNNQPYQKYVDAGYFRIIESKYTMPTGEIKISLKTVVFQKGVDFIRKIAKGE